MKQYKSINAARQRCYSQKKNPSNDPTQGNNMKFARPVACAPLGLKAAPRHPGCGRYPLPLPTRASYVAACVALTPGCRRALSQTYRQPANRHKNNAYHVLCKIFVSKRLQHHRDPLHCPQPAQGCYRNAEQSGHQASSPTPECCFSTQGAMGGESGR